MALGRAQGITFTNYDNVNFVLSNDLDCCAWGGSYYSAVDVKWYGATWEPPWGQETGTYSHEMGHSIGLPHSGWVYYAYDSPWDMMSMRTAATNVICGSYNSINNGGSSNVYCSEPGDGYIAGHKDYLGWIPSANEVVTDTSSSVTATLEADALPLSTATKIIKICITGSPCTGSSAHYFTVEARVEGLGTTSQFDNGIPGEGIIIHEFLMNRPPIGGNCFFNSQSGWALPIDSTPGDYDSVNCNSGGRSYPNYALFNAQWSPGQTYMNSTYAMSIHVVSRIGSTFVVSVGANTPADMTSPPPGTTLTSPKVTFTWSAGAGGALHYYLYVGSTVGGAEYGGFGAGPNLSVMVPTLPIDGSTVYVRLWTSHDGGNTYPEYNDYSYTASSFSKAVMTSPAPGSTLTSRTVTFTWSAGTGATQYYLYVGSTVGGAQYSGLGTGTNRSTGVATLPNDGSTVYVRLWSLLGVDKLTGAWQFNDYTYTACTGCQ